MAPSFEMLLVAFFVGGVANSVFHPADFSILSASVDEARHGRAFAIHTFTGSIGYALAPLTMAGLAYEFGWQTALIIAGSLGLICSVIVTFAWPVLSDDASTSRDNPPGENDMEVYVIAIHAPIFLLLRRNFGFWYGHDEFCTSRFNSNLWH